VRITIDSDFLFDGFEVRENASVVLEGERIISLGKREKSRADSANSITCKFLMPGLTDMHVHISGYEESMPAGTPFRPMKRFLKLLLRNGVTTVRDVGNNLETIMYLRKWIEKYPGPMIFSSGPMLDAPPITWAHSRITRNPREVELEVDRLYVEAVDLIKVYKNVTEEILEEIINQAARKGLRVAAHLEAADALNASNMGVNTLEHIINLVDESYIERKNFPLPQERAKKQIAVWSLLDLASDKANSLINVLAENNTYVCPTLLALQRLYHPEDMLDERHLEYMIPIMPYHRYLKRMRNPVARFFLPKYVKEYMPLMTVSKEEKRIVADAFQKMREFTNLLQKSGVKIIAGTDTPNPSIVPGFSLHQELTSLAKTGIPPQQVLASATSTAAAALGRDDIGVIQPHAYANLLLLDGNPIENIEEIDRIEYVILKGKTFSREELTKMQDAQ
jgi:imidazolonepropionase-like amidohydrolase